MAGRPVCCQVKVLSVITSSARGPFVGRWGIGVAHLEAMRVCSGCSNSTTYDQVAFLTVGYAMPVVDGALSEEAVVVARLSYAFRCSFLRCVLTLFVVVYAFHCFFSPNQFRRSS